MIRIEKAQELMNKAIAEKENRERKNAIDFVEVHIADRLSGAAAYGRSHISAIVKDGVNVNYVAEYINSFGYDVMVNDSKIIISWGR